MKTTKLVKRSAVRDAFHGREARVPRGFFEDLELDVQVAIRRYLEEGEEALPSAGEAPELLFLRRSAVKDAIRQGGRGKVGGGVIARLSAVVEAKVTKAIEGAAPIPKMLAVPGRVFIAFIKSPEHKAGMTCEQFQWRFQSPEFRRLWVERAKYKGPSLAELVAG